MPLSCGHLVCHACIHDLNTLMTHAHQVSLTGLYPPDLFALRTPWCLTCHPQCMPVAWEIATKTLDDKHTHIDLQHTRYPAKNGSCSCPCIYDDLEMCQVWYTPVPRRRPPPFHLDGSHTLAHTHTYLAKVAEKAIKRIHQQLRRFAVTFDPFGSCASEIRHWRWRW